MSIDIELESLQERVRQIRQSQGLTLQDVAARSKGAISAIALGSYESELFKPSDKNLETGRIVIDLRKLTLTEDPIGKQLLIILKRIVAMRRDWNGEVISLRSGDVSNLQTFAHFSSAELSHALEKFALAKLKECP